MSEKDTLNEDWAEMQNKGKDLSGGKERRGTGLAKGPWQEEILLGQSL